MPDKAKQSRPGKERYIRTQVNTGLKHEVAYTLAEDVEAMAGRNIAEKIDVLKVSLTGQIQAQNRRIEAVETSLTAQIQAQTVRIDSFRETLMEHAEAIKLMETRHAADMKSLEERIAGAMASMETRHAESMRSMETRHVVAMKSMETRHAESTKAVETRLAKEYSRVVNHVLKLLWVIVGVGVLAMLSTVADWVRGALGF